ncbi:HNH endonuclease family protein (plasmid) [Streptomyces laculatispora]|uniref:HNH endonuclease family protein n=1 Tax=Streptomyces laculatispora TaxID=887464 RepID=A0ABY9IFC3_9ACTN|nr:HNH endonuclease family protein [Streptomyces laculatispora]WLQ45622.1 HNH endonuclease family protein [Streptomyces laculatispora]
MITKPMRGIVAAALTALPLFATAPAAHAVDLPSTAPASFSTATTATAADSVPALLTLADGVGRIPVAAEQREGYKRELYKHWNKGLDATDGCDTRREVILSEAVEAPHVAAGCKLSGGSWTSAYDGTRVTDAGGLDVDHMVPLAEVHDSGGYGWDPKRREAYANDQDSPLTLIAVTAKSNRSKADKDPAQWLPPSADYRCQYAAEWTATKLRWDLAGDEAELEALQNLAAECPTTMVAYDPAP